MYITGYNIPAEWKIEMTRYLAHHVNEDGGWGLHLEDTTTVFATTMYYIVLRILGMEPEESLARRARERLLALGMRHQKQLPCDKTTLPSVCTDWPRWCDRCPSMGEILAFYSKSLRMGWS
jgi:hypothetical protein